MIDASHGNSGKDHRRQPRGRRDGRRAGRGRRARHLGVMMESFLVDGRQDLADQAQPRLRPEHHRRLHGLDATEPLHELAKAVALRRAARS